MTPGIRTSEFKVMLLAVIVSVVSYAADWVSHRYAFAGAIFAAISYVVSRGLAKYEPRGNVPTG